MNNQLIQLFLDLVQIDSPTGEEEKVRDYIIEYFTTRNIPSTIDTRGNVIVTIPGKGEPLLFIAHMDTVEPGRGIKPQIKDGYITSDGTTILGVDNKLSLACMLYMVDHLTNNRPLELVCTVSEESGRMGSDDLDFTALKSKYAYCFDSGRSLGVIVTSSPTYERFDIEFRGQSAHASRPHLGQNVIPAVTAFLQKMNYGFIDEDKTLFNVGITNIGDAINTVPGFAIMQGEIRSLSEESIKKIKQHCQKVITLIQQQTGIKITITWWRENKGYMHESKEAKAFIATTERMLTTFHIPISQQGLGLSDANSLNANGIICLEMGHGGEKNHSREERVKISTMHTLAELMIELAKA